MGRPGKSITTFSPELSRQLFYAVTRMAQEPAVKAAVEANHDENRWWPTVVRDWRLRMAVAGWSGRVSYHMVSTYAGVVADAERFGFDQLTRVADSELAELVRPLGLAAARVRYFRSLSAFLRVLEASSLDPLTADTDRFIALFAEQVYQASYKVAQCATLYARGYHCGIMPVDSGMVSKLAPRLGMRFSRGSIAHQEMRKVLETCVTDRADEYCGLARTLDYAVTIPGDRPPTWWVHLVLIYFKRLYCSRPSPRLCSRQPVCDVLLDCGCLAR
jgi:hypothetical protein